MIEIRKATIQDAAMLQEIYKPYVEETFITFEYDVPSVEEFKRRIQHALQRFPYYVALKDQKVVGYAYASDYYTRAAYEWTAELSIYVSMNDRQAGIGTLLYDALEEELAERGFYNVVACIAYPNPGSIEFHIKRGYTQVAHFKHVGFKLGEWRDIVWLQKQLQPLPNHPLPIQIMN